MSRVDLDTLHDLATAALVASKTREDNARCVADALVAAEADGIASHGVSRVPFYADQAASGKVDGCAVPEVTRYGSGVLRVDARDGFAFPAIRAGLEQALAAAKDAGVVAVSVGNSHHCGAGGYHVEFLAERGLLALGFSNTPAGIAPWGGAAGSFGTNPIAFACPRADHAPLVVDLSLSKVARGKVMLAAGRGEPIPADWALDAEGRPTTDAKAALAGTMLPIGDAKGAALALMVELLTGALAGSNLAFEASSFFTAEGDPPRIAQTFIALLPDAFSGAAFPERVECLLGHILDQPGTRLPGDRRLARRSEARAHGVDIPDELLAELRRRAG